ncbi:MAG: 5'-nucleotidase C-terminal domain-containing protein, partial [Kangiellaceae bacterium]|nr:5'-nucleotidase C-terminal domain-containing protein [Kangiellaceae bacterium]
MACSSDDVAVAPQIDETIVGFSQVDIDANKPVVRGGESIFGNLVADAMYFHAIQQGFQVDAAIINGGNLRFNGDSRPDGIYLAGPITRDNIAEMLPFQNTALVMQ